MKYLVLNECETYYKTSTCKFVYDSSVDNKENIIFDDYESAKKYVDDYKLSSSLQHSKLYLEILDIFKYDDEIDDIIGDSLYTKAFDLDKISKEYNIDIEH